MVGPFLGLIVTLKGEKMGKRLRAAFLACFAIFCLVYSVSAQVNTADILGTVTDAGGAVIANAKVTVQNTATNETRTATTSSERRLRVQPAAIRAVHDFC